MKKLVAFFALACAAFAADSDLARWKKQAADVTILRDDWGIAHVHGKTDADAVFGMIYAQAEDDFNRVETNYLNSLGRLAETEGESRIYQDLRMKLFIDPAVLKQQYAASPGWLQSLMNAFADGLNYYLATHPAVKPRVITHFEPWMALSFTEGSIGGDIERINLNQLQAFYGKEPAPPEPPADPFAEPEPTGSNGIAIAPSNTAGHHALLLINPHTSWKPSPKAAIALPISSATPNAPSPPAKSSFPTVAPKAWPKRSSPFTARNTAPSSARPTGSG
jgi:acyl-homoserine-lactone acylase